MIVVLDRVFENIIAILTKKDHIIIKIDIFYFKNNKYKQVYSLDKLKCNDLKFAEKLSVVIHFFNCPAMEFNKSLEWFLSIFDKM